MSKYTNIIERLEKAEGPDRVVDGLIYAAVAGDTPYIIGNKPGRFPQEPIWGTIGQVMKEIPTEDGADYINAPNYTSSLDAAIALCERLLPGWGFRLGRDLDGAASAGVTKAACDRIFDARSTTLPIALLIAMFKALEAMEAE